MAKRTIDINKKKLILAEGEDAVYFLTNLIGKLNEEIKVLSYGGINGLTKYLKIFSKTGGFDNITSLLIARDSETSSISATQSINTSLKAAGLIKNDIKPFTMQNVTIKDEEKLIGYVLFPGYDENNQLCSSGTLEDLCLKIFHKTEVVEQTHGYLTDYQTKQGISFKRLHKNRLHSAFSFTDDYVGLKLGEALKAGAYDKDSPYLKPFLNIIKDL